MRRLIDKNSSFDAVILAAGDFPKSETALSILRNTGKLIVCDSAMEEVADYNSRVGEVLRLSPLAVVGDGDSLRPELKQRFRNIWHHYSEQAYNDLTKATRFAIENYSPHTVAYLGTTGKREDHTIGNLSLMLYFYRELGIEPCYITDYGWFSVARGKTTFEAFPRQQVSIFNSGCKNLESEGLRWDAYPFSELWQGTLNESVGTSFSISGDGIYVVYQTFEAKIPM